MKYLLLISAIVFTFFSCKKDSTISPNNIIADSSYIKFMLDSAYNYSMSTSATKDSSFIYGGNTLLTLYAKPSTTSVDNADIELSHNGYSNFTGFYNGINTPGLFLGSMLSFKINGITYSTKARIAGTSSFAPVVATVNVLTDNNTTITGTFNGEVYPVITSASWQISGPKKIVTNGSFVLKF